MGTKIDPGQFDCYSKAKPDEPMFHLLARDPSAEYLVEIWRALRAHDKERAIALVKEAANEVALSGKPLLPYNSEKSINAEQIAVQMNKWRHKQ